LCHKKTYTSGIVTDLTIFMLSTNKGFFRFYLRLMNINDEDDLFDNGTEEEIPLSDTPREDAPLADRMRPRDFPDFVGQTEIIGQGAPLRILIETDQLRSLVFWGPPGTGKTTLAMIIARKTKSAFISLSAVTSGIKDVKTVMEQARKNRRLYHKRTILFIDEIHRFNKAQQDAFLPYVEDGSVILIGATTENPSFSVVSALMSRCRVFVLRGLESDEIVALLTKALADKDRGLGNRSYRIDDDVLVRISQLVDGDARRALNLLELTSQLSYKSGDTHVIDATVLSSVLQRQQLIYDKTGEEHYNIISALHKSMRSSDVQAALYWCSRMLQAGDDPLYVARRLIRFASEDIGNSDPQALTIALAARQTYDVLGSPEGELAILQCVAYLATAPKSNSIYMAQAAIAKEIAATGSLPVPLHIRNAPTKLMAEIGYGKGYQYDHDSPYHFSGQECLPDGIGRRVFYRPNDIGFEREIKKRMDWWDHLRKEKRAK